MIIYSPLVPSYSKPNCSTTSSDTPVASLLTFSTYRPAVPPERVQDLARRLFAAFPLRAAGGMEKRFVELPEADHNDVVEEAGPELLAAVRSFLRAVAAR